MGGWVLNLWDALLGPSAGGKTQLTANGVMGARRTFAPKTAAVQTGIVRHVIQAYMRINS